MAREISAILAVRRFPDKSFSDISLQISHQSPGKFEDVFARFEHYSGDRADCARSEMCALCSLYVSVVHSEKCTRNSTRTGTLKGHFFKSTNFSENLLCVFPFPQSIGPLQNKIEFECPSQKTHERIATSKTRRSQI